MIEITGEFDFFVAGSRDLGNRAFYVRSHGVANGVKLEADAADGVCGVRSPGGFGCGGKSCGDGSADKCATVHAPHSTSSEEKGTAIRWKNRGHWNEGALRWTRTERA